MNSNQDAVVPSLTTMTTINDLAADVAPGRHVVTVFGSAGTARRVVHVEAGAQAAEDVPIFSGVVAVSAPLVLDVSENGRGLGTTENQIILTPGRHELRLSNKDLDPLTHQRWGSYNLFAFWMSDVHSVGGYVTAGQAF